MTETARVKYVFVDIVAFTKYRSVEAQIDVIAGLNAVVRSALTALDVSADQTIFLPTGDGIAVALLNVEPFDIHIKLALEILRRTEDHNTGVSGPMRKFMVRIGVNENVDNLIIDINGKKNVAGNGISMAQRIMDTADGGQIIVGQSVYETLQPRELYMDSFRKFSATTKHGAPFPVHQFLSASALGLNEDIPTAFVVQKPVPIKISQFVAYYMALAMQNRPFLMSKKRDPKRDEISVVLLCFLAEDAVNNFETPIFESTRAVTWNAGTATFEQQYTHYAELEFRPLMRLARLLAEKHLSRHSDCFESDGFLPNWAFVTQEGVRKLREEWPQIADEFNITAHT